MDTVSRYEPELPKWELIQTGPNKGNAKHQPFTFFWKGHIPIKVRSQSSDGFSWPIIFWPIERLGLLSAFQAGVHAAFTHDYVCKTKDLEHFLPPAGDLENRDIRDWEHRKFTRSERVEVFKDAVEATNQVTSLKARILWHGVRIGSRYFGTC